MTDADYTIPQFVDDLRRLSRTERVEARLLAALRPLAQRLARSPGWRDEGHYVVDEAQGFGMHLLHEEPDHTLTVLAVSWLPGRGTPPHDHGTWAVVAGVDGPETNRFWRRTDDGSRPEYAELEPMREKTLPAGEVLTMPAGVIHSVRNDTDRVTLSLHVYGKHVNFTERSQFDPERRTRTPFVVKVEPAH
jgi:predicted metal-dependent enzyme (double-stranded beta helix superfamily)